MEKNKPMPPWWRFPLAKGELSAEARAEKARQIDKIFDKLPKLPKSSTP